VKVLLIGASGFLGRHLCRTLARQGVEVTTTSSRDADLTRDHALDFLSGAKFDLIYHLAAWTRAGEFCSTHGGEQWLVNQQINTNVLAWWARQQPQAKIVAFGTSVSYPKDVALLEENYLAGLPIDRFYSYAMTKRMLLVGLQCLSEQHRLRYLYAVPSTLYGPDYHTDGRPMHFIYDLICKIIRGREFAEPVVLWGDGYQRRELVYVDDFIEILQRLVATQDNTIFNIGAGEEYRIRDFARVICESVGYPFEKIQFDTARYVGAKSKCLDTQKVRAAFPDLRMRTLREGLEPTIEWVRTAKVYRQ
jgi:GDP-L-fucose synthase